jgi:hypothetical protein
VTDDVDGRELGEVDVVDVVQDVADVTQPDSRPAGQVDLGDVTGDDHLGAEPEPGQEHLHLLGEVFCASSRMMNASLSVRPRI